MNHIKAWAALLFTCFFIGGCSRYQDAPPLSPAEALRSFKLDENFRIELFAAEPHVVSPVEVVWDENGLAYAVEMRDYPEDPPPGQPHRSRIRVLEDRDGDGRIDHSAIFAENLLQATSLLPWKGGLIVCAAPDILYLKDTDGDRKADERKVLFSGFALVNPESRITNLRLGVDNWIYASNNGQTGEIRFLERPDAPPVSVVGADFRFRLDRRLFEAESGPTQFGQAMDDWGNRFITENTVHVRHVVIPRRYLARNPYVFAGEAAQDVSDHGRPSGKIFPLTGPQRWRQTRSRLRQQRYRENKLEDVRPLNPSTEIESGYFTGAAGGTIYAADAFPEAYRANLFTGEVSANLVHRDILRPDGVTFRASRADSEKSREFLASTDPWFRPCNFATGPDGNLYLVDIYREFIETPESVPEDIKKEMNFWSGDTLGRIYRIVPKSAPGGVGPKPELGRASSVELVGMLGRPNAWWRLTAQRLIIERQDLSVIPLLTEMAVRGATPQARLHALYALEGLGALGPVLIESRLGDTEPGIREHAIRLSEGFPQLADLLIRMKTDASPRVRLQLVLSLGEFVSLSEKRQKVLAALAELASAPDSDRWFRTAILSSAAKASIPLLDAMVAQRTFFAQAGNEKERFLQDLAVGVGARQAVDEIDQLMRLLARAPELSREPWLASALEGLARGFTIAGVRRLHVPAAEALLERSFRSGAERVRIASQNVARHLDLRSFLTRARKESLDRTVPAAQRRRAISLLAGGEFVEIRPVYEQILSEETGELVEAAIRSLGSFDDAAVAEILISRWKGFGPGARNAALDVMMDWTARIPLVLAALESGRIEKGAFDVARREKLLVAPDAEIRKKAAALFAVAADERQRVVEQYRAAMREAGDAARGRGVFEKNCAVCHLSRQGRRIGPDLSGVNSRTREQLVEDILNPSRAIQPRYTNYLVLTQDGRMVDGLIIGETPGTLTVRRSSGEDEVLLRSRIKEIRASTLSVMPDGLEAGITRSDLSDLVAFLQGANLESSARRE